MNFIGERETPGNVVKKRCGEIGMLFRILFWISLLFLAAKVIWAIYIGTMPEASFRLTLMDGKMVLVGCLIISLSYIFEYGSALQKEADETL